MIPVSEQESTFGKEHLAQALIRQHTEERNFSAVEEDFRWLGETLLGKEREYGKRRKEDRDSMEEWLRRQSPSAIWVATLPDSNDEVLVTHWPDGSASIALRIPGSRTWGPPLAMESRPVS